MTTISTVTTFVDNGDGTATFTTATSEIMPADVSVNDDGTITLNVRLKFLNPFDINTTGVGTITVLPDESLAAFLPMLGRGAPGLSPALSNVVLINEIGPNDPLPANPASFALVDPGDPTATPPQPRVYQLTLTLRKGAKGDAGTPVNLEALANVRYAGTQTVPLPGQTVVYRTPDGGTAGWYVEAVRTTDMAVCTAFTPASGNQPIQQLGNTTLAKQSYDRRPFVTGCCRVNPAADTANGVTHIDVLVRMGDRDTGIIVAFAEGLDTSQPFIANLHPTPAANTGQAIIPAGTAMPFYMIATQTNATLSNWSTGMAHASLTALGLAIV